MDTNHLTLNQTDVYNSLENVIYQFEATGEITNTSHIDWIKECYSKVSEDEFWALVREVGSERNIANL